MFQKSRIKIVTAIMTILVLLWLSTLCVIYISSYMELSHRNQDMLQRHVEMYTLSQDAAPPAMEKPGIDNEPRTQQQGDRPPMEDMPAFQLSTFYSVAMDANGTVLETNNDSSVYTSEELENMARAVIAAGETTGTRKNLLYYMADKGSYTLVAFMDNTIMRESMTTLFRYTLLFGALAILALFFVAVFLARKIVRPLEESYQKQKQFVSDAGHELKTPISVISTNADLLARELPANQWLANIQYENERMGKLVGQLLELAKTENTSPPMESVNFSRIVTGEALPFESIFFEKGFSLECHIQSDVIVHGCSGQLKQLIAILLDNALRHGKKTPEDNHVHMTLKSEHSYALLTVVNQGDPIDPQQQKQIFERFYRIDSARNSETQHYGLGLSIAKAIVTTHHGKIEVYCTEGKVTFMVRIPLQK